jgi:oligopeptide transport system substrate-binding protein
MRGVAIAIFIFALPAWFAGCQRRTEADRARDGRILLAGNSAEPKALDPQLVSGVLEGKILSSLFEGLVADSPDSDTALPPGAATDWEHNETFDHWTFHLRRGGKWSDGQPLTARDFVFSYHRILHPLLAAPYAEMLYFLKNAETYNKDRRGEILFRISPPPGIRWEQVKSVNFRGDPSADLAALGKNPVFGSLDDADRRLWLRAKGLDSLTRAQLEWIAAAPANRFGWPASLPPDLPARIVSRLLEFRESPAPGQDAPRDLWHLAKVGARADGDFTLVLDLREAVPFLPSLTRHHTWYPVPRHVVLRFGKIHDRFTAWSELPNHTGNGAFRLAEWRMHSHIEVRRNPHYWDAGNVWLRAVRFLPIENPYTETRAFLAGQLHTTYSLPPDLIAEIQRTTPQFLRKEPYIGTTLLRINTTRPGLDDPKVRRALSLAIDRKQICRHILEGYTPAASLTPPMGDYRADPVLRHDPGEARRLLAEAGFPEGKGFPRYTMLISRPSARPVTETLQGMWKQELGILVDIQNKDWGSYVSAQHNLDFDIAWGSWIGDYLDPTTFLNMWTAANGNNNTGWASPEYEKLLRQAAHTPDPAARLGALRRAERALLDARPVIPVSWYSRNYLHSPYIQGWHPLLLDNHPWKTIRFAN